MAAGIPLWCIPLSFFLSLLDWLYALPSRLDRESKSKFFSSGFGDMQLLQRFSDFTVTACKTGRPLPTLDPKLLNRGITLDSSSWGCFPIETYRFISPVKEFLPKESHEGHAQILLPADGKEPVAIVVHLAATGDQGFNFRKENVARALAAQGIASIILETPTYGQRRQRHQIDYFALDVATYLCASYACMWESQAWAQWAMKRWPVPCVLAGTSYGGCMALGGFLMAMSCRHSDSKHEASVETSTPPSPPFAVVSFLGSETPRALLTGIFNSEVDDVALQKDMPRLARVHPEWAGMSAMELLMQQFASISAKKFAFWPLHCAQAHLISAKHDWVVIPSETRSAEDTMAALGATVEPHKVCGGHMSSIALTRHLLVPVIISAVMKMTMGTEVKHSES